MEIALEPLLSVSHRSKERLTGFNHAGATLLKKHPIVIASFSLLHVVVPTGTVNSLTTVPVGMYLLCLGIVLVFSFRRLQVLYLLVLYPTTS